MHEKIFSIFISSTFEDLKEERQAVQDVVISSGDFPVQMESFPAADQGQFEFIKALIDKCDYYVLILAGRYGTISKENLSYTHMEYRYAASKGVPILVMLHGNRGYIPSHKSENTEAGQERLAQFITEVSEGRLIKKWESKDGLRLAVREALDHAKATKEAVGWVRGNAVATIEALEELNEVRKENAKFRDTIGILEVELSLPPMPSVNDEISISILSNNDKKGFGSNATISTTWIDAFPAYFNNLVWHTGEWNDEYSINEYESCIDIGSAIAGETMSIETSKLFKISKSTLHRLTSYYIEAGLMKPEGSGRPFTEMASRVARRQSIAGQKLSQANIESGVIEVYITPVLEEADDIFF